MFKKIAVSGGGYPALALAYWLRFMSPLVEIYVYEGGVEGATSVRRWGYGLGLFGERYVHDVLGVEAGEPPGGASVHVKVTEPSLIVGGERRPLFSRASLDSLLEVRCVEVRGPWARQLGAYVERKGGIAGGDECVEARIEGGTWYEASDGRRTVNVWGGVMDENVEQAAAEVAMRILGLPPGLRVDMKILNLEGGVDFEIGSPGGEHTAKVPMGDCHVRIGTSDGNVTSVSGSNCRMEALWRALTLLLGRDTADWMPLLAVVRSPLFAEYRLLRGLLGLWRKNLPRRVLQIGEGERLGILA